MEVVINGEAQSVPQDITIAALLEHLRMDPRYLAVERNFTLIPRQHHSACILQPGDNLEIVTLVGVG